MKTDPTFDLIDRTLEKNCQTFAFEYTVVDMRRMMRYIQGDRSMLSSFLSPKELERYEGFALPKKKLQWLAGRLAVKAALTKDRAVYGQKIFMPAIDILHNENRAPYIVQYPEIQLSISHSFPYCIGVVSRRRIGIDLEKMIAPHKTMFNLFFHPHEVRNLPDPKETEAYQYMAMKYWTRKEALSKLLGLGMKVDFRKLDTVDDELILKEFGGLKVRLDSYLCSDFVCSITIEENA
jgi:phosphopantetheinyl transferase